MSGWEDAATAIDGELRREVFFLSGPDHLFASMYSAYPERESSRPPLVICPSWGHEMFPSLSFGHALARRLAVSGGAGLVLHWPGHGDSGGDTKNTDLDRMARAVEEALREARGRHPQSAWGLAGIRLGAAAAVLAAAAAGAASVLLIRPALDQVRYFSELERASRRASLGREYEGSWAFGYPLPTIQSKPDVPKALASFEGPAACITYEAESPPPAPRGLRVERLPGSWEADARGGHAAVLEASLAWMESLVTVGRD